MRSLGCGVMGVSMSMRWLQFLGEVMAEARRVTWPAPRETAVVVCVVAVVVAIASLFFLCVDYVIFSAIDFFLNL